MRLIGKIKRFLAALLIDDADIAVLSASARRRGWALVRVDRAAPAFPSETSTGWWPNQEESR